MAVQKSGARKFVTRVLATGVLLSLYAFGVVATTGAMASPQPTRNAVVGAAAAGAVVTAAMSARESPSGSARP